MKLEHLYNVCEMIENGEISYCKSADVIETASVCKIILDNLIGFAQNHEDEDLPNAAIMNQRNSAITLSSIFEDLEYYTED